MAANLALASLACGCESKQMSLLKASILSGILLWEHGEPQKDPWNRCAIYFTMKTPKYNLSILRLHKPHQCIGSTIQVGLSRQAVNNYCPSRYRGTLLILFNYTSLISFQSGIIWMKSSELSVASLTNPTEQTPQWHQIWLILTSTVT